MKTLLDYLKLANQLTTVSPTAYGARLKLALITNFTDDLLQKVLAGICLAENIYPEIYAVPFGQYYLELKNPTSPLYTFAADSTFVLFDANPYYASEFTSDATHATEVLADLRAYAQHTRGLLVLNTLILPPRTVHGNLFKNNPLYQTIGAFNVGVDQLATELTNVHLVETNHLAQIVGERHLRDWRNLYAFRQPFTNEMITAVAHEWLIYLRALLGKNRKCLVVDLDNTLWGGIVGEVGAHGIALGPDYPGNAFQNFQRLLLELYNRGIILAINSHNNLADVQEVFATNQHMILREQHFAAKKINWENKADNLRALTQELNIGLDSLVFLDDDPTNRELVRTQLPEVYVPEFSLAPEYYAPTLLTLNVFQQLALTAEDAARGQMYAAEQQRALAQKSAANLTEFLAQLNITLKLSVNTSLQVARVTQLTQKTNQFNLTTRRYNENDIITKMQTGLVFTGDITDKFGGYGLTIAAIVLPTATTAVAELDTFLMSCRVLGRQIERAFLAAIIPLLRDRGFNKLRASFIPSAKNAPAADFLANNNFILTATTAIGTKHYELSLVDFPPPKNIPPIQFIYE